MASYQHTIGMVLSTPELRHRRFTISYLDSLVFTVYPDQSITPNETVWARAEDYPTLRQIFNYNTCVNLLKE